MFEKILIANRGEIACRVATTATRLGMRTVAVYSDADAGARHVELCDEAFHLGPAPARESYLRGDEIVRIAKACGAQAIHPGYGFLSENEAFAQACANAGLVFVGPPPAAIRAMGLKSESKRLMAAAGVPLVPGYHEADQDPDGLRQQAELVGYPVLIKASAGGGGKGMRIVASSREFDAMLVSCKREAAASFGNDAVLIERYVVKPRHVEIQVFADRQGNCVHLFERDCSVQRRHQKVIEEAPAPGMTAERRAAMGAAAVAAARAVGYVGAGTVEFIVDPSGAFFFMEMNTRLQVEHPVTEMITGFDLVEWQLRVAAGESLPVAQESLAIGGHSIEARIYAENPEAGFLPSTGVITHLTLPASVQFQVGAAGAGGTTGPAGAKARVRVDSGVRAGDAITPHYDPMIAKLITWGEDRDTARRTMARALAGLQVVGPSTNIDFLRRLMANSAFASADLDTGLIDREREALLPASRPASDVELSLAAAAVLANEPDGTDPWSVHSGWRLGAPLQRRLIFTDSSGPRELVLTYGDSGCSIGPPAQGADPGPVAFVPRSAPSQAPGGSTGRGTALQSGIARGLPLGLQVDGARHEAHAVFDDETLHLFTAQRHLRLGYADRLAHAGETTEEGGRLTAPMPGKVIAVLVKAGSSVAKGDPLLIMEAMKMEHTITAPAAGRVRQIHYAVGDQVAEGEALVAIEQQAGATSD